MRAGARWQQTGRSNRYGLPVSGERARSAVTPEYRSVHPNVPGVPWWGAVLIAAIATAIGFAFDAGAGKELTGVFASLNRGQSWFPLQANLPTVPVYDLKIHPRDHELIAATHGRSLWVVDIAALEQMTPAVLSQNTYLFKPKTAYQWGEGPQLQLPGNGYGQAEMTYASPAYGAEISYRLPAGSTGNVRLIVSDIAGDTLATLNGPGGAGVQFITQYAQSGLKGQIPLYTAFTIDSLSLPRLKDQALGIPGAQEWVRDLPNAENKKFVDDFRARHKTDPSFYGAQTYDAVPMLDSIVKAVNGDLTRKDEMRRAAEKGDFKSVRGKFKFGPNHIPIQNFYLQEAVKEGDECRMKTVATIVENDQDKHVGKCKMPN